MLLLWLHCCFISFILIPFGILLVPIHRRMIEQSGFFLPHFFILAVLSISVVLYNIRRFLYPFFSRALSLSYPSSLYLARFTSLNWKKRLNFYWICCNSHFPSILPFAANRNAHCVCVLHCAYRTKLVRFYIIIWLRFNSELSSTNA